MICVFFELPYQRQIKKIYKTRFDLFQQRLKDCCQKNGGSVLQKSNKYFFCFSSQILAYEFSSVRFLFLIKKLLDSFLDKIESYKLIVEIISDTCDEIDIENIFDQNRNLILDENSFYITNIAYNNLKDYIKIETTEKSIFKIIDFLVVESEQEKTVEQNNASIVLHANTNFYWAIYNFILQNPITDRDLKYLTEKEQVSFDEVKNSLAFLRKHRFEKSFPEYFVDAFLLYGSLYFKIYKQKNQGRLPVIYSGDLRNEVLNNEVKKIQSIIPDASVKELSKKLPSTLEINENMLSLIFLITLFSDYLFVDEITDFFISENKTKEFFYDLCDWLYTKKIIFEKRNLYAHSTHLQSFIKSKITNKIKKLYKRLADFLILKYENGEVSACEEFVEILQSLDEGNTKKIIFEVLFHKASNEKISAIDFNSEYGKADLLQGFKHYQKALKFFSEYDYKKSLHEIKAAIDEFKFNKFVVGEYKAMIFWGELNLRRLQFNDATNYFNYAVEIAHRLKDSSFLCDALFKLCVVYFLKNDLTFALRTVKKLYTAIENNFMLSWNIKVFFIEGRIYAKLGEYKKAEILFQKSLNFSNRYFEQFVPICDIWSGLMICLQGDIDTARKIFIEYIDDNFDASLFYIWSFFTEMISKDESDKIFFENVKDFSVEKVLDIVKGKVFNSEKNISGFSIAEDFILPKNYTLSTVEKLFEMFLLYYRGKVLAVNLFNSENKKHLKNIIEKMTNISNDSNNNKNTYAHWFYYFCYDLSSRLSGEYSSEAISLLSKSFKILQGQVMVITENETRDKYMQNNFWNTKILFASKLQKLL